MIHTEYIEPHLRSRYPLPCSWQLSGAAEQVLDLAVPDQESVRMGKHQQRWSAGMLRQLGVGPAGAGSTGYNPPTE